MEKQEQKVGEITKIITKRPDGSVRIQERIDSESMTQQQFAETCDINLIMAKYLSNGEIQHLNAAQGVYADLTQLPDYQQSLDTVIKAKDAFMTMDAKVRSFFQNDPAKLISFLEDEKNLDKAIELGLVVKAAPNTDVKSASAAKDVPQTKAPKKTTTTTIIEE